MHPASRAHGGSANAQVGPSRFTSYEEDRPLHGSRFERETDESPDAYFHKKEHIASSIDGLPGLPLPLPPTPAPER